MDYPHSHPSVPACKGVKNAVLQTPLCLCKLLFVYSSRALFLQLGLPAHRTIHSSAAMVGSVFASGVRAHVFGETVGTGTHAYPSEVSLSVQHAAVRAPRSSKLPSNNHNASPAPYFNSSEPQRGAQGMKDAGTGCGTCLIHYVRMLSPDEFIAIRS